MTQTNQQGAPEALYASAMEFAAEKASISYVQRKCRCSWNDAEQMLERMVREGIIATYNGQKSTALVEAQQPATHVQNPAGIEHVAGDVSKNGVESNMAQQPAPSAAAADTVVLEAALRAIHQAIDLIGEPDTERLRTVRRVLRGAVVVAEDCKAPQADIVLEDAARLDWLALAGPTSICLVIDRPHDGEVEVATDDVTGYGKTLREAIDAAMKKGGAT